MKFAFAIRKAGLTLYLVPGSPSTNIMNLLTGLGKYKLSGSCLHIKRLADIDLSILEKVIVESIEASKNFSESNFDNRP